MTPQNTQAQEPEVAQSSAPEPAPSRSRRKAVLIGALAVAALAGAASTYAFTTRTTTADHIITFGSVRMELIEQEEQSDGSLKDVPDDYEVKAENGVASRIVSFQNVGGSDMYVRARPVLRAVSADGENRGDAADVTDFKMDTTGSWEQGEDGWWYYDEPVEAATDGSGEGETTDALMTGVEFMGDFYDAVGPNGRFEFTVEAQAVQVDNNGDSALEAQGWPTAEGAQE